MRSWTSSLPEAGRYAVGIAFLTPGTEADEVAAFARAAEVEGVRVIGWRDVPVNPEPLGPSARAAMPVFRQVFVAADEPLRHRAWTAACTASARLAERDGGPFFASLSSRTLTYKGMLTTYRLEQVFPDVTHELFASEPGAGALALLYQHVPLVAARSAAARHRSQR
ncbi:hypothetical protein GCM10025876_36510 [Demequina litorisediminis]|uniref:Glutamine amidotransferase type-2 domain-containing protein n=1 Tax=Demequina litorisediminis TaxID=1849022 RepID=A0ABQ6IL46_9MICO|nr:hypothetical protein GCM10025876_36510 [Demequina litorisediminis]